MVSGDAVPATQPDWISEEWDTARFRMLRENLDELVIIIDEIQKINNWSEYVKKEWDRDSASGLNLKAVILGSSRLLLQQGLTESLAGRFESIYIPHWSFSEMRDGFGFSPEQYTYYGGYPGAAQLIDDENRWRDYVRDSLVETSVSKDILMLTRIEKPALLKRVFELGAGYSGMELSYTKMLGQLQDAGNTVTLAHYLSLLDQAGLLAGLEKYAGERVRQRASSPKFQVHNNALMSVHLADSFADIRSNPKRWGRVVESAIGAHLLNGAIEKGMKLQYWRDGNNEVDFILEWRGQTVAIEVKSGTKQRVSGLRKFNEKFSTKRTMVVGDSGIDWREFLEVDPSALF